MTSATVTALPTGNRATIHYHTRGTHPRAALRNGVTGRGYSCNSGNESLEDLRVRDSTIYCYYAGDRTRNE